MWRKKNHPKTSIKLYLSEYEFVGFHIQLDCLLEYRYIVTTLAVIGKACIISTFLGIYVFTVELYPTIIR